MTILRPLAAFITATVTGLLINLLPEELAEERVEGEPVQPVAESTIEKMTMLQRIRDGLGYAFGELLKDIGVGY